MQLYLQATSFIDCDHPAVVEFANENVFDVADSGDKAVRLYFAVRDGIRYDPYSLELSEPGLRASTTLDSGRGWCVAKAILLAACCRAVGIRARLGFADVRNHLSTKRMRELMKTDVFYWHGYASIHLNGTWLKATPAFNTDLCKRFNLKPLDFDGHSDALFHPCDVEGRKHMEYLRYHGEFADVPLDRIIEEYSRLYPSMMSWERGDFEGEVGT